MAQIESKGSLHAVVKDGKVVRGYSDLGAAERFAQQIADLYCMTIDGGPVYFYPKGDSVKVLLYFGDEPDSLLEYRIMWSPERWVEVAAEHRKSVTPNGLFYKNGEGCFCWTKPDGTEIFLHESGKMERVLDGEDSMIAARCLVPSTQAEFNKVRDKILIIFA